MVSKTLARQKPKPAESEVKQETAVDFKQWYDLVTGLEEPTDDLHTVVCVLGQVGDNISASSISPTWRNRFSGFATNSSRSNSSWRKGRRRLEWRWTRSLVPGSRNHDQAAGRCLCAGLSNFSSRHSRFGVGWTGG